jgi:predicted nucleic-acid-binding protein
VLRSGYSFDTEQIATGLSGLAGLSGVFVEEPVLLATAIEWMRGGMDFADALHLAKAGDCTAFLSFDKKLAKPAKGHSGVPVEAP